MANMTQTEADRVLNYLKGTNHTASQATFYLGLFTTSSALNAQGTEVTGGSYARKAITAATDWSAISTVNGRRQISNASDLVFATASADWGTVVGWELLDASSAGNRIAYGDFDDPMVVLNGKTAKVLAGQIVIAQS